MAAHISNRLCGSIHCLARLKGTLQCRQHLRHATHIPLQQLRRKHHHVQRIPVGALRNVVDHYPGVERAEVQNGSVEDADRRFPFKDKFSVRDGRWVTSEQIIAAIEPLITADRLKLFEKVVAERTFSVLPILEGLYDAGNFGAVCRSAEALGCGGIHVVRSPTKYAVKPSRHRNSAGGEKWLDVRTWRSTTDCLAAAKEAGYQVVVTHLNERSVDVRCIDWTRPTAVVLGNEAQGVSEEAVAAADYCAIVPTVGMVASLNVSVAAAMVLYEARSQRLTRLGAQGDLTPPQRQVLKAVMLLRHMTKGRQEQYIKQILDAAGQPPTATGPVEALQEHRDGRGLRTVPLP